MMFNTLKSTLVDRITGRVVHGTKSGPETMLTPENEEQLAAYLIDVSKQGYGKSRDVMATAIAKKRGKIIKGGSLSKKWWQDFLKRHPEISTRASQNFGLVRTLVTKKTIYSLYSRLLEAMTHNPYGGSVIDKPALIF